MKRTGGFRRKTRHKLAKNYRDKGKMSLIRYFQEFNTGEQVCLVAEPSYHNGMYFPRFHGRVAVVQGKRGTCYEVVIKDGSLSKTLVVHPIHLNLQHAQP